MTNIEFAVTKRINAPNAVRIVARGPRISPRDAYAANHLIVDRRTVYRRQIEIRAIPSITLNGARN